MFQNSTIYSIMSPMLLPFPWRKNLLHWLLCLCSFQLISLSITFFSAVVKEEFGKSILLMFKQIIRSDLLCHQTQVQKEAAKLVEMFQLMLEACAWFAMDHFTETFSVRIVVIYSNRFFIKKADKLIPGVLLFIKYRNTLPFHISCRQMDAFRIMHFVSGEGGQLLLYAPS